MVQSRRPRVPDTDLIQVAKTEGRVQSGLQLRVVEGPDYGRVAPLTSSLVVGTDQDVGLTITDSTVSRRHCELTPGPLGVEVRDLDSKNGVYQHGVRLVHGHLRPGAEIVLGRTVLRLDGPNLLANTAGQESKSSLHGNSSATRQLRLEINRAARAPEPALVEGELGSGRARVARAIHEQSNERAESFVVIQASSLDHAGLSSRIGTLRGTVLLADVEELCDEAKKALVDELEAGRIGARLLTSTTSFELGFNADPLSQILAEKLGGIRVRVPPLRERASDLPALITEMLMELGQTDFRIGPEELGKMQAHLWPGNLRELKSHLVRLIESERTAHRLAKPRGGTETIVGADLPYKEARARMIQAFEREYAQALLDRTGGNVSRAARLAGIDRVYLHRLIKKYGLKPA